MKDSTPTNAGLGPHTLEALRESENRYRSLVETIGDWIAEVDPSGILTYVSPQIEDILGYRPEEVLGKSPLDLMPKEEAERVAKLVEVTISSREPLIALESVCLHKNGRHVVFETNGIPIRDADGTYRGYSFVSRDRTERKQAEEALRISQRELSIRNRIAHVFLTVSDEEMYAEVLEVVLDALQSKYGFFGYIDEKGDLVCPSMTRKVWPKRKFDEKEPRFARKDWGGLWGRSMIEKKALYANDSLQVPDGHVPLQRALVAPVMHKGELIGQFAVADKESPYDEGDKESLVAIADYVAPVLYARRENERLAREHAEAEQREAELQSQLAHMGRLTTMGELASGLAHELNQPLAAIAMFAAVAAHDAKSLQEHGSDKLVEACNDIAEQAHRAGRLIRRMRQFVKKIAPRRTALDLRPVVDEILPLVQTDFRHAGIPINIAVDRSLPKVRADRLQVEQVLLNLIRNALEAMQRAEFHAHKLSIEASTHNNMLQIAVRDTGDGIPQDQFHDLFSTFYTTKQEGLGMGLAISRSIVEAHGGNIWAESNADRGTTFTFTLPIADQLPMDPVADEKGTEK